jgi:hypothetical protein
MTPGLYWQGSHRVDLTVSLPEPSRALTAARAVVRAFPGATMSARNDGYWQGQIEASHTVSVVSDDPEALRAQVAEAIRLAHVAGCVCVQVESWDHDTYTAAEYRRGEG